MLNRKERCMKTARRIMMADLKKALATQSATRGAYRLRGSLRLGAQKQGSVHTSRGKWPYECTQLFWCDYTGKQKNHLWRSSQTPALQADNALV